MKLKAKHLGLEAGGKCIVVLNKEDAADLGVHSLGRVYLKYKERDLIAIVNTTRYAIKEGTVGVFEEVAKCLDISDNTTISVEVAKFPRSVQHIKDKIHGKRLTDSELLEIVQDVVDGRLNEIELASFVTALYLNGIDLNEIAGLANAMVNTGERLEFKNGPIVDKHSIGGLPGDKTTIILVPIIAACGLTIPKTSSRAITSAAGTADRAEVLMPVQLSMEEMKIVVRNAGGCIVWGGSMNLAPADDKFIRIEYPLSIDPLMMPSIMSKKKAVGSEYLVIDMPTGPGAKMKTAEEANALARDFIEIGRRLGINAHCAITNGTQPLGHAVGAAPEAREALQILMRKRNVPDIVEKVTKLAGILLEMVGKAGPGLGQKMALHVLKSGKAEERMRKIIFEQGGDSEVKPEDIEIGRYGYDVEAQADGRMLWLNNKMIASIGRAAGSPKDKSAGLELHKKVGDKVKKGERIFTIHADKMRKLNRAIKMIEEEGVFAIGKNGREINSKKED